MTLWLRSLLIWLLVLAVPAQAAAAASMAFCGPGHHPSAVAMPLAQAGHSVHAHHEGDAPGGQAQHFMAEQAVDASDATAADLPTPAKTTKAAKADKQKCSVCASCCSGGAILSTMPQLVAPEFGATEFVAVARAIPVVAAGGPDRPPRNANA